MATTAQDQKFQAVAERHGQQRADLLARLLKYLFSIRTGQSQRYSDWTMADATIAQTLVVLDTYLHEQRLLTRSFASQVLKDLDAAPRELPRLEDVYPRSGPSALEVYRRPVETYWWERSKGATDEDAAKAADDRFQALVEQDMALVARDEAQKVYASSKKVIGRRRIIHPELSKTGTCGLCIAAATRMYYVEELLPLHGGCNCDDVPVVEGNDPGLTLNREDLDKLYAAAGSTAAADLARIRATVDEHGELGPILVREGQKFRDAEQTQRLSERKQINAWKKPTMDDQRKKAQAMVDTSTSALAKLREAKATGATEVNFGGKYSKPTPIADLDKAIGYHQDLIDRYSALLK